MGRKNKKKSRRGGVDGDGEKKCGWNGDEPASRGSCNYNSNSAMKFGSLGGVLGVSGHTSMFGVPGPLAEVSDQQRKEADERKKVNEREQSKSTAASVSSPQLPEPESVIKTPPPSPELDDQSSPHMQERTEVSSDPQGDQVLVIKKKQEMDAKEETRWKNGTERKEGGEWSENERRGSERDLGYNHFYGLPNAEYKLLGREMTFSCSVKASSMAHYLGLISDPRLRSLLGIDVLDFRSSISNSAHSENNLHLYIAALPNNVRNAHLLPVLKQTFKRIYHSLSSAMFVYLSSKGYLADAVLSTRSVEFYITYKGIDGEQEVEALADIISLLQDLPVLFCGDAAKEMNEWLELYDSILLMKTYVEEFESGHIDEKQLNSVNVILAINTSAERLRFGMPFTGEEILELIRKATRDTKDMCSLELMVKERPDLIGSAQQFKLMAECLPQVSKSIDSSIRDTIKKGINLCLQRMSSEEIGAAFDQFYGHTEVTRPLEWFPHLEFHTFASPDEFQLAFLHSAVFGKLDVALEKVLMLLSDTWRADARIASRSAKNDDPKALVINALNSLPFRVKAVLRGEERTPKDEDLSFGQLLVLYCSHVHKDEFISAATSFLQVLFDPSVSFISVENCMRALKKAFKEGPIQNKPKIAGLFTKMLAEQKVREYLYSPHAQFSLANAFEIAIGEYVIPKETDSKVITRYAFIKEMLTSLNSVIEEMEKAGKETDYNKINETIDTLSLEWYLEYMLLTAFLPSTLKPRRLDCILKRCMEDPNKDSAAYLTGNLVSKVLSAWPLDGGFEDVLRAGQAAVADFNQIRLFAEQQQEQQVATTVTPDATTE